MKKVRLLLLAMLILIGAQATTTAIDVDSLKHEIIKNSKELREQQKDSIMLSKLSPTQLLELRKQELAVKLEQVDNQGREEMPLNGFGIVIIVLLPFLFVAIVIALNMKAKTAESKRKYDLYTKSLEMGQTVPEHFFDEPKTANPSSNLKKGILCLVVGLALLVCFLSFRDKGLFIGGIIPTFVGIGYLLVHLLDKPKTDTTSINDEQHG